MDCLNEEERALLAAEPELQALAQRLSKQRTLEAYHLQQEYARERDIDEAMAAKLHALRTRNDLWKGWCEEWQSFREAEHVFLHHLRRLAEDLIELEDKEHRVRSAAAAVEAAARRDLYALCIEKHTYLVKCTAWEEDCHKMLNGRWEAERAVAEQAKVDFWNAPDQKTVDEAEIAALKKRLVAVSGASRSRAADESGKEM